MAGRQAALVERAARTSPSCSSSGRTGAAIAKPKWPSSPAAADLREAGPHDHRTHATLWLCGRRRGSPTRKEKQYIEEIRRKYYAALPNMPVPLSANELHHLWRQFDPHPGADRSCRHRALLSPGCRQRGRIERENSRRSVMTLTAVWRLAGSIRLGRSETRRTSPRIRSGCRSPSVARTGTPALYD